MLRIFAVSGYDWDTAFLVSTTIGFDDGMALFLGSLMVNYVVTAVMLMWALPLLVGTVIWGSGQFRVVAILSAALGLVVLVGLTASHQLWWLPVSTISVFALFVLIRRLNSGNHLRRALTTVLGRVGWTTGAAALLIAAFVQTPWVPHEQIVTTEGTVNGYVLSIDSGYLNVITDEHDFIIILSSDVVSRK